MQLTIETNMASINKTMWNCSSMVEVGKGASLKYNCTLKYQHDGKYYEGMVIQVYIIFCYYNLVSLKIMRLP